MISVLLKENFEIVSGIVVLLLCLYLSITVFLKNSKSATNKLFSLLSVLLAAYVVVNYISLHPPGGQLNQLWWIRMVMFVCSFIGPVLVFLVHNFPADNFTIKPKLSVPVAILCLGSAVASLSPLVFSGINFPNGKPLPTPGIGMPIFLLDFVGLFILSFTLLFVKYLKAEKNKKKSLAIFVYGVVVTFTLMAVTTVISVTVFKNSNAVLVGPLSSAVLALFIAYAIVKHHIFNVKILLTEFLVALIIIIVAAQEVALRNNEGLVLKIFFVFFVGILGLILVKNEKREIQHEKELEHYRTIQSLYTKIQELDRQKTEFLTIAAHQLRTPVSIINNYVSMLNDGDFGQLTQDVKDVLVNVDQSNQWLVRLADEFLNIANLEQGQTRYHIDRVSLDDVVESVIVELTSKAQRAGAVLSWQKPIVPTIVMGDTEKLRAVVFNFVDNALKYGVMEDINRPSTITIITRQDEKGTTLEVHDNGIGFTADDEPRFFQKFSRGDNARSIHVNLSTGLGLYICRKFIEGHSGKVWAKSAGLGKGSVFGFWIPSSTDQPSKYM